MKVIREGHRYELENFENKNEAGQIIQFIEKEKVGESGKLETISDGTTNEEVLEMLINRLGSLYDKFPSVETSDAIVNCKLALKRLEDRTKDRARRGVEGKHLA